MDAPYARGSSPTRATFPGTSGPTPASRAKDDGQNSTAGHHIDRSAAKQPRCQHPRSILPEHAYQLPAVQAQPHGAGGAAAARPPRTAGLPRGLRLPPRLPKPHHLRPLYARDAADPDVGRQYRRGGPGRTRALPTASSASAQAQSRRYRPRRWAATILGRAGCGNGMLVTGRAWPTPRPRWKTSP